MFSHPSERLADYFKDYSAYHKTAGNKFTHYLGIPFIVVSLLGLLSGAVIGSEGLAGSTYLRIDGGVVLLILGLVWYFWVDWKITIPFAFILTGFYFTGRALPTSMNWSLFAIGWIFQGVGHALYEKKSPAFFKNLTHILIGPLWIFARLVGYEE